MNTKEMKKEKYIGCHLSSAKGFAAMGKDAVSIGANTFAFFTRNPRGGKAKEIDVKDAENLLAIMEEYQFGKLVAHAPYTLNPCSATEKTREFAYMAMKEDMEKQAYYYHDVIFNSMSDVRKPADRLEMLLDKSYWPFPSYGDLLFEV